MEDSILTVQDCAIKACSKKEIYGFLTIQGNVYLPPIQECNHEFIRGIVQRTKKVKLNIR